MRCVGVVVWFMAAGVLAGAVVSAGEPVGRLGLDSLGSLGLRLAVDEGVKVEGGGALRVETAWPVTVCLGELQLRDVSGGMLVYEARVRTELKGSAYLEMWLHFGEEQYFSRGLDSQVVGRGEWTAIRTVFFLPKDRRPDKATLNLVINGMGKVWIDDVRLFRSAAR
jgi:hypothetical protein